jgi:hypothetical protein
VLRMCLSMTRMEALRRPGELLYSGPHRGGGTCRRDYSGYDVHLIVTALSLHWLNSSGRSGHTYLLNSSNIINNSRHQTAPGALREVGRGKGPREGRAGELQVLG